MNKEIFINLSKSAIYKLWKPKLSTKRKHHFAYIFHTESLHNPKHFEMMLQFLQDYTQLTGKRALATLMSGAHPRIIAGMAEQKTSELLLVDRMQQIGRFADLGYHGHYAFVPEKFSDVTQQIKGVVFDLKKIEAQIEVELTWFKRNEISIGPYYSAGWWFQSPWLYPVLAKKGFQLDASISYSPWLRQINSYAWFKKNNIKSGEPVLIDGSILNIQNILGCHNTKYPDDFIRNANALWDHSEDVYNFMHSHDFDLHPEYTLNTLSSLKKQGAKFLDVKELLLLKEKAKSIDLPTP